MMPVVIVVAAFLTESNNVSYVVGSPVYCTCKPEFAGSMLSASAATASAKSQCKSLRDGIFRN